MTELLQGLRDAGITVSGNNQQIITELNFAYENSRTFGNGGNGDTHSWRG